MSRGGLALSLAAGALAVALMPARVAHADHDATQPPRVEWNPRWRSFRWWEYGGSAVLGATSYYLHYEAPLPAQAKWQGDNPIDDSVRGWLRADSIDARTRAGDWSDRLWWGGTAIPFVVDLPVVLIAHRQPRLAWELLMMDLEANAVSGFITNALFFEVGRGRPSYRACAADPAYDALCGGTGNNASFPSGHVLAVANAAGLTCVHHNYLPLYGSSAADGGACAFMLAATAASGVTRIVADRHYTTDVVAGAVIGFATGYGLPWLLHYRYGAEGRDTGVPGPKLAIVPFGGPSAVGLGVVGVR